MSYQTRPRRIATPKRTLEPKSQSSIWSFHEKKRLLEALKKHGFSNLEVVSKEVQTRSVPEVVHFINTWSHKVSKQAQLEVNVTKLLHPGVMTKPIEPEKFPPIALWKKTALNSMQGRMRKDDYSFIYSELFKKFAEEEPECSDPNMPNFKNVYKYLSDALGDTVPAQMSPVDSCVVLSLLEDMRNFICSNNFQEEFEFAKEFLGPARFLPVFKSDVESGVAKVITESSVKGAPTFAVRIIDDTQEGTEDENVSSEVVAQQSSYVSRESAAQPLTSTQSALLPSSSNEEYILPTISGEEWILPSTSGMPSPPLNSTMDEPQPSTSYKASNLVSSNCGDTVIKKEVVCKTEVDDNEDNAAGMLTMPLSLFHCISQHAKVKENLNPLMTHIFLHKKEQMLVKEYIDSHRTQDDN